MSVLPVTISTRIAFEFNPLTVPQIIADTSIDCWYDVTAYVREVAIRRGRQHELDRIEAGTATVVLANEDRRFEPYYASSPYYPYVLPMRRLWIQAGMGYPQEVMRWLRNGNNTLIAYWRFGERLGTTAYDASGCNHHLTLNGSPSLDQDGALSGDTDGALGFDGTDAYASLSGEEPPILLRRHGAMTIAFWIKGGTTPAGRILGTDVGAAGSADGYAIEWSGADTMRAMIGNTTNKVEATIPDPTEWHHVVFTWDGATGVDGMKLYVDGVVAAEVTSTVGTITNWSTAFAIGARPASPVDSFFEGDLDEVAMWQLALTAGVISVLYAAASETSGLWDLFTGFIERWPQESSLLKEAHTTIVAVDGFKALVFAKLTETYAATSPSFSDARVTAILDDAGWPAMDRIIATGQAQLQAQTLTDQDALSAFQTVVESENGLLFVDGAGRINYQDRHYRLTNHATSEYTFNDLGTGGNLPYYDLVLISDDAQIWNDIRVTRDGGTEQQAVDATSQAQYFPRTLPVSSQLMTTDSEALDSAQWKLAIYKDPDIRAESMTLRPQKSASLWRPAMGLTIGSRLTVERTPPGGGDPISKDVHVEAIQHRGNKGFWETTFRLSPSQTQAFWILGVAGLSELGETTKLGY